MAPSLWKPGDSVLTSESHIYLKTGDEDAVRAAVLASGFTPRAIAVKPNGEEYIGYIHGYLTAKDRSDHGWIERIELGTYDFPIRNVLRGCSSIVLALRDHSADLAICSCQELAAFLSSLPSASKNLIPDSLPVAVNWMAKFAFECLRPIEHGSPFIHSNPSDRCKEWWTAVPLIATSFASVRTRIRSEFGTMPQELVVFDNWLADIGDSVKRLQAASSAVVERAMIEASAYCAALGERYLLRAHRGLAILLLHRASDLLLLSVCTKHHMIDFAFRGGRYKQSLAPPPPKANSISLINSLELLESIPVLAADAKRKPSFEELNNWRNLLMQTHYMSDVDDMQAREVFRKIRSYLEGLGGSEWVRSRDRYLSGIELTLSSLLDIDGTLSRTFSELHY